jgi:hypothetical protein
MMLGMPSAFRRPHQNGRKQKLSTGLTVGSRQDEWRTYGCLSWRNTTGT